MTVTAIQNKEGSRGDRDISRTQGACSSSIADGDGACANRGRSRVGACSCEDKRSASRFGEAVGIGRVHRIGKGHGLSIRIEHNGASAIFDLRGVIRGAIGGKLQCATAECDISSATQCRGVVQSQSASTQRGAAIVGVGSREGEGACACLDK